MALAVAPAVARRIGSHPPVGWLLGGLLVYYVILARYAVWWGGFCFGPRYWTEAMPLLAPLLAFGLDWARTRSRAVVSLFAMTIAASVALQAIGAFCYPSNWGLTPSMFDLHHERLWDWSDSGGCRAGRPSDPASEEIRVLLKRETP